MATREKKNLMLGLAFLTPNILGFLALTIIPLVLSLAMAFTNWDLNLHNMFRPDSEIKFVGLDNFIRLFQERNFYKYFGNTLFFMMGIPFGIAGSLLLATLLTRDLNGGSKKIWSIMLVSAVFVIGITMLMMAGMHATAMGMLMVSLIGVMLIGGISGGSVVYRTLYFLPSFTAGVAVYILWAKLYNKNSGPINRALTPILVGLSKFVDACPPWLIHSFGWLGIGLMALIVFVMLRKLYRMWYEGDLGVAAAVVPVLFIALPVVMMQFWTVGEPLLRLGETGVCSRESIVLGALMVGYGVYLVARARRKGREFGSAAGAGFGSAAMLSLAAMVTEFLLLAFAIVFLTLPECVATAKDNVLRAPDWLGSPAWSKPALMIMGFWAAIGSRNMLLYIAGLSNIPQELYEAADIDGAGRVQRFWHVTWPQLAPTTFFIVVMSVIGGLQGGFEMARTMTQGGPAGSTTTLSYFIYTEGFSTGRLGYASAIAWTLFAVVFTVTMFNWRFGNRYVND